MARRKKRGGKGRDRKKLAKLLAGIAAGVTGLVGSTLEDADAKETLKKISQVLLLLGISLPKGQVAAAQPARAVEDFNTIWQMMTLQIARQWQPGEKVSKKWARNIASRAEFKDVKKVQQMIKASGV